MNYADKMYSKSKSVINKKKHAESSSKQKKMKPKLHSRLDLSLLNELSVADCKVADFVYQ